MLKKVVILACALATAAVSGFGQVQPAQPKAAARPLSIGILVDNSGSYRTIFERVVTVTNAVIQDVRAGDEAFLVTFVDSPKVSLRQEMTKDTQELRDAAENMFIQGGATSILDAVVFASKYMAAQASPGAGHSRVIVLITDGDERASAATVEDALKAARDAGIRIYVLGLHEEKFYGKLIDRLVRETGGVKFVPKMPKETAEAVSNLLSAMRAK